MRESGGDGFVRADQINLKSLDEKLERHLNRAWTMEKKKENSGESEIEREREEWEIEPSKLLVKGVIGRGTFSTVHRGFYDDQDVAVKLLDWGEEGNRTKAEITSLRAAFSKEVSVWHKLDHPNVTKEAATAGVKLLCFPESFSFIGAKDGDALKIAELIDGPIMQKYCSLARESNMWLSLGGFQEKGPDEAHLYNSHVLVDDFGNIKNIYRKIHLFDVDVPGNMVYKESSFTTAGEDVVVEDSPVGRLGLTVCYDLRFPNLYQQLRFQHHAQVLLVPAAFTKVTGEAHWEILLRARAIETQCYVIAATQTGRHNEKRESYGDSLIVDPWGTIITRLPDRLSTGIAIADIDFSRIDSVRTRMPISEHQRLTAC